MPTPALLADATAAAPAGGAAPADAPQTPFFANPLFLIGMMALFYVVVILPGTRRSKREAAAMMAGIKPGSKVYLSGGIVGSVVRVKDGDEEVVVKSEDARFRVLRSSIVRVVADDAPAEAK